MRLGKWRIKNKIKTVRRLKWDANKLGELTWNEKMRLKK